VVNHREQIEKALDRIQFPLVVKPNVGGSGAGIVRFDSLEELRAGLDVVHLGPDGTALVQEYIEPAEGAIVRVEVLDGRGLYAIRIVREVARDFNLCPADICQVPLPVDSLAACPVDTKPTMTVARYDAPREAVETAERLTREAGIDVGGVEYLVGARDGLRYFYDVNATSNFVADAPRVLGFDPFQDFVESIVARAVRGGV
jgi:glutathione synthase/RimK-type ligase-like ATP-grasp enzyme